MILSKSYLSVNIRDIWCQIKNEPLCFWFLCGYLFFEYVRPQTIYPTINFIPWMKIFVILALFSSILYSDKIQCYSSISKYFCGLIFVTFLSSVFAEYPDISFNAIHVVLNWIIIYYLFIRIVTTKFRFYIVILLIMLASYKMSQHAAISWVKRGFSFEHWGISGGVGFFGNAADLGVQMLIILPLAIVLVVGCHSYWGPFKKLLFILFPITVIMTIIATGQRNTLVGLATMGVVAVLSRKNRIKWLVFMGIFAFVLVSVMPQPYLDRFDTAGVDATSQSRLRYWRRGIEIFQEHPVLGIGLNNWQSYYQKYYPGESLRKNIQEVAHSTPITILSELGILGFIFYYGIALKTIILNIRSMKILNCKSERIWKDIPFALNIGMVGFLTSSIFLSIMFYPFLFIQVSLSSSFYNIIMIENREYFKKYIER